MMITEFYITVDVIL